jgi:hypothetical protein
MADDEQVENIFDKHAFEGQDGKVVPVVIETGEGKRQVGEATLEVGDGAVFAHMVLKNDDPQQVVDFLKGGLTRISVDDAAPELKDSEMEALAEFPPHDHKLVQHRDGREPWCDFCGLSIRFDKPIDRLEYGRSMPQTLLGKPDPNFGFPKPSRLHDN